MTRREIREHIFLMLFRRDFYNTEDLLEQMEMYIADLKAHTTEEYDYLSGRFHLVLDKLDEIDTILSDVASGWKLSRMGKVDLAILRLSVFEMRFDEDIPVKVAINEAVELAKKFGGDESPAFVNGVLAKLV